MPLKIIGSSHIAKESMEQVERTIRELKPKIVAIELDQKRLHALLSPKQARGPTFKDIGRIGIQGYLFALLGGWMERKLGSQVGVLPGDEMRVAIKVTKEVNAQLALIDQDIEKTLKRLSQGLTWKEKFRFVWDIVVGVVFRKGVEFDLSKVPQEEMIVKLLGEVRHKYPTIYRVLVFERNEHMARVLVHLLKTHPQDIIVAVVGAGHKKEIADLVKKYIKPEEA
ncbi:TraB/GumN family protein [Candidatus Woesearchaeota archaeon]|nr:TraB/GumN family protein [Candidatus Woesearchaeota archaeon]